MATYETKQHQPVILETKTLAQSRLFHIESVDLRFSNGVERTYERMLPTNQHAVMIVPIIDQHLILVREYAVGIDAYELGFPKGVIDPGEDAYQAANRELQEEIGFAADQLDKLAILTLAPSYFANTMTIVLAQSLYPQSLTGDEPEPLQQIRWPIASMLTLLEQADFNEARNVSALFLTHHFLHRDNYR